MKIVANGQLAEKTKESLEAKGFEVKEVQIAYEQLSSYTQKNETEVLWLLHTGLLDKELLSDLKHLKVLVLASQMVEIELVDFAQSLGIEVVWAEEALSNATAELVFAHLFNGCRLLPEANRNMPLEGDTSFKFLQESYSNGIELSGKTLGVLGMNKAGLKVAQKALALGMDVLYWDERKTVISEKIALPNGISFPVELKAVTLEEVLKYAHFITVHTTHFERYIINAESFGMSEHLIGVINCAYPEAINEVDLVEEINKETILFAGIDRFEEEPHPVIQVLMQPAFSLSPNINSATQESKLAIDAELIEKVLRFGN